MTQQNGRKTGTASKVSCCCRFEIKRPNFSRQSLRRCNSKLQLVTVLFALTRLAQFDCLNLAPAADEPIWANEIQTNGSQLAPSQKQAANLLPDASKDVANLSLWSDFRAIKLSWTYEASPSLANLPAAFRISYCELTFWQAEIRCRQKELRVEHVGHLDATERLDGDSDNATERPKESPKTNVIRHLVGTPNYEAQIFDLRALTNYTINVQVARFEGEPPAAQSATAAPVERRHSSRAQRFEWPPPPQEAGHFGRVETRPFGAEAAKCFANSSEVLINTGRYFGGKISVEAAGDARCQLLGNKSSEQTAYLFRIDHQVCGSKIMDANRIETMILVHENRDILTHNTARFLVLCNIKQKSFTVRASVSLPKVHSVSVAGAPVPPPPSRPAEITPLSGAQLRRLGSMLGVFRPARVGRQQAEPAGDSAGRSLQNSERSAALQLDSSGGGGALELPKPIDVASKILYVERAGSAATTASARQPKQLSSQLQPPVQSTSPQPPPARNMQFAAADGDASEPAPILVTNNHRVLADLVQPLAGRPMLYSAAAKVGELALAKLEVEPEPVGRRLRGGRTMRPAATSAAAAAPTNQRRTLESRMGETEAAAASLDLVGAESQLQPSAGLANYSAASQLEPPAAGANQQPVANQSLAQNITGALLRWSLRTLGNFARKSLESLVHDDDDDELRSGGARDTRNSSNEPLSVRSTESSAAVEQLSAAPPVAARADKPPAPPHRSPQQTREPKRMAHLHLGPAPEVATSSAASSGRENQTSTPKPTIRPLAVGKEQLHLAKSQRTGSGEGGLAPTGSGAAVWLVGLGGVSICVICLAIAAAYLVLAPTSALELRNGAPFSSTAGGGGCVASLDRNRLEPSAKTRICRQDQPQTNERAQLSSSEFAQSNGQTYSRQSGNDDRRNQVAPSESPATSAGNTCNEQFLVYSDCVLVDTSGRFACKSPNESFA